MNKSQLIARAKKLFGGKPYVVTFTTTRWKFLVLAYRKLSDGEWTRDGKPVRFHYLQRTVIANATTWDALWNRAVEYSKLESRTKERLAGWQKCFKSTKKTLASLKKFCRKSQNPWPQTWTTGYA